MLRYSGMTRKLRKQLARDTYLVTLWEEMRRSDRRRDVFKTGTLRKWLSRLTPAELRYLQRVMWGYGASTSTIRRILSADSSSKERKIYELPVTPTSNSRPR